MRLSNKVLGGTMHACTKPLRQLQTRIAFWWPVYPQKINNRKSRLTHSKAATLKRDGSVDR